MYLVFTLLSSMAIGSSIAFANPPTLKSLPVVGGVQFWQRTCSEKLNCALPESVGQMYVVRGTIVEPETKSQVGYFGETVERSGLRVELHVYWKVPDNEVPHLVYQQRLSRNIDGQWHPISECSTYTSADTKAAFPVGACSGYLPNDGAFQQWGVSFIKAK